MLLVAREIGTGIAREGWNLVCGGGGGVMEAACAGFRSVASAGGVSIGIIPGDDPTWASDSVDIVIPTGIGWARNAVITRTATAVVAISGCAGTLSEIAFAWQMGKPIVAMASTGGWSEKLAGEAIDHRREDRIMKAMDASEAMVLLRAVIEGRS